ncbi:MULTISPECIES: M15 family metallopeptidase [Citrobacter]|uniref:M15 family metallopeptidase n=1 Tax=Citrobacter TaxID=544 RepID=UPI0025758910|nr:MULTISPECIES: M15 family metallopeptidase [Citrobacter]MDM3133975.1 M15 family metallopeptidase [Citrobacter sp. Cf123]MDM3134301.1 M15 family metallopeptidase [Citrobacter sp. Cf123]MDM3134344.1 M15 family metallopeptidase [Citrobacter sp. Cf123]MDM3135094.1 M15 family metallopeptidase [Citrobacter sp. Cf123]MDS0962866.1 M15 family metallopeptidase [Citrobacter freundii]
MQTSNFKFSQRSENNLKGVKPALVNVIRRALELTPVDFIVIEGLRTQARQKELVATGKSQTMNSRHLTGNAVDIIPVNTTWNIEEFKPLLKAVKQAADEQGLKLRFGINWKNDPALPIETKFIDAPHVEIPA